MNSVALRKARSTDAGRVGAILSEFIDTTDWMPRIHTRAEDLSFAGLMIERGWVTLSETDAVITGFIARNAETIHALYVAGDCRNRGHGAALLEHMQQANPVLGLWTFQANTGAQAFYARHGFVEVERTDGAGNDEGLPDIRLEWRRN